MNQNTGTWLDAEGRQVHMPVPADLVIFGASNLEDVMGSTREDLGRLMLESLAQMSDVDRRLADHLQTFTRVFS